LLDRWARLLGVLKWKADGGDVLCATSGNYADGLSDLGDTDYLHFIVNLDKAKDGTYELKPEWVEAAVAKVVDAVERLRHENHTRLDSVADLEKVLSGNMDKDIDGYCRALRRIDAFQVGDLVASKHISTALKESKGICEEICRKMYADSMSINRVKIAYLLSAASEIEDIRAASSMDILSGLKEAADIVYKFVKLFMPTG